MPPSHLARAIFAASPFAWAAVLLLAVGGCTRPTPQSARPTAKVRVQTVQTGNVAPEVTLVGTVLPLDVSRVASGAPGKVIQFPFRAGERVDKDDLLAELRSVTLKIQIASAQALEAEKLKRYEEMKAGYRAEEIRQAKARMLSAQAEVKYTEARLKRVRGLVARDTLNQEDLDEAESLAEQARQKAAEATADYELKSTGHRPEQVAQAQAAYEAQQQEVLRLQDELSKRQIKAPYDGFLVEKHTDIGEWVELGGAVATLANLSQVEVLINVEESYVGIARLGEQVDVYFDAVDETFPGEIVHIVPRSDWKSGSRSFPVRIRITNRFVNDRPVLKEGMLAEVTLRGAEHEAILVHKDAIVRSSGHPVVYVVNGTKVRPVVIDEGLASGEFVEVRSGDLQAGQRVVTEGVERLRPMQEVAIQEGEPTETTASTLGKSAAEGQAPPGRS